MMAASHPRPQEETGELRAHVARPVLRFTYTYSVRKKLAFPLIIYTNVLSILKLLSLFLQVVI